MEQQNNLLGPPVDICTVPERGEFIVSENFAKYRGEYFDKCFLGTTEASSNGAVLRGQKLLQHSHNPAIIAGLGGYLKARITLADVDFAKKSWMLRRDTVYAGYVEDKIRFPTDETFSYFNERGEKCVLREFYFDWYVDCWRALADRINSLSGKYAGFCILSRNSSS